MIGKSIRVKGTITGDENLVVDGTVEGAIDLPNSDLTIGESGKVTANLTAKVIKVDGEVTGDIAGSEKVILSKTGTVRGNITAPRVTLDDGAKFKGSIDMDPSDAAAKPAKGPAAAPADAAQQQTG